MTLQQHHPIIPTCDPTEVALKSFFLGPQSENAEWLLEVVDDLFRKWFRWRRDSFPEDGTAITGADQRRPEFRQQQQKFRTLVAELTDRFEEEIPKFSPRYVGHMVSEISLPALMGHILTLMHNPNIIARESARVATDVENEAVECLAHMLGLPASFGHFTSGGTVANFEAVVRARARLHAWIAVVARLRQAGASEMSLFEAAHLGWDRYQELRGAMTDADLAPFLPDRSDPWEAARALEEVYGTRYRGPALIVPSSAHYSWKKAARLLGIGESNLYYVEADLQGRYDVSALKNRIDECARIQQPVLAVVSVAGTTETGAVDPIDKIQTLLDEYRAKGLHIWHHVDAAYGGFFCTMLRKGPSGEAAAPPLTPAIWDALAAIGRSDSVTVDPHKLGYVPYSSGTFLTADERDYSCVLTLAPYLDYEDGARADHGPYTLEGSRSAAGAVATWLTARSIGLHQSGYGLLLSRTIRQKQKLERWLAEKLSSARLYPICDTNLICFCIAAPGEAVSVTNARTLKILGKLSSEYLYTMSKTEFPLTGPARATALRFAQTWDAQVDAGSLIVLRLCLMNPFFDSVELDINHIEHLVFSICEFAD